LGEVMSGSGSKKKIAIKSNLDPNDFDDIDLGADEPRGAASQADEEKAKTVMRRHEDQLLSIEGIVGSGIGRDSGIPVINIYVVKKTKSLEEKIPSTMDGIPVRIIESGEFKAL
jgi:hypothetical protein